MSEPEKEGNRAWLDAFHAGNRDVFERLYREHFGIVHGAVKKVLFGADAETVTHDVFLRLLANRSSRESFQGGNIEAWLTRVATNAALDYRRRYRREATVPKEQIECLRDAEPEPTRDAPVRDAPALIDRFRRDVLPPKYRPVFEKRFLEQLGQREAARALGMHRTTLIYYEARIRSMLEKFVLRGPGASEMKVKS